MQQGDTAAEGLCPGLQGGDSSDEGEDTEEEVYRVLPQPIIAPHMTPWSLRCLFVGLGLW